MGGQCSLQQLGTKLAGFPRNVLCFMGSCSVSHQSFGGTISGDIDVN